MKVTALVLTLVVCAYAAPVEDARIEAELESLEQSDETDLISDEELDAVIQTIFDLAQEEAENAALQESFAQEQDLASDQEVDALAQSLVDLVQEQAENAALQEFFAQEQVPVELQGSFIKLLKKFKNKSKKFGKKLKKKMKKFGKKLKKKMKKFGKKAKKYGKYALKLIKKYGPTVLKYGVQYGVPLALKLALFG